MPFALTRILSFFYQHNSSLLAITDDRDELQGFLSRDRLDPVLADLERARALHERIPRQLLLRPPFAAAFLSRLSNFSEIPVVTEAAEGREPWDQLKLFEQVTRSQKQDHQEPGLSPEKSAELREGHDQFLTRTILSGFPDALFAARLDGSTLFFNQAFDDRVIGQVLFKKSLRLVEEYFRELTREELARAYERSPRVEKLEIYADELGMLLQISQLVEKDHLIGYLYILRPMDREALAGTLELFYRKKGLETMLDEMESSRILSALRGNENNISHAATELKIKRTTLQNKMKRLNLAEKYGYKQTGPVPRKKKTQRKGPVKNRPQRKKNKA
ncbi:MAG: hypothetical protein HS115_08065 [Spirochaetales bacterium]|nr:hypothetical protein [Spirochaetales bacterium]